MFYTMNQKTAKLLRKYSKFKNLNPRHLKKEWISLNKKERTEKRQEILKELVQK